MQRRAVVMLVGSALAMGPLLRVAAYDGDSLEYRVKAAFLLNFTKFIEWPAAALGGAGAPFAICILGADPFGSALDRMVEGETVNDRKLVVRRLGPQPPRGCQMVFAGSIERDRAKMLASLGRGVLTVGEGSDFLRAGGMIAFVIEDRRVRFDINQAAAAAAGLKISSKLLNVARSVEK